MTQAGGGSRTAAQANRAEFFQTAVRGASEDQPPTGERALRPQLGRTAGADGVRSQGKVRERSGPAPGGAGRAVGAGGHGIGGRGAGAGAAARDGVGAEHAGGDRRPTSSPLVGGVGGEQASAVARDEAVRKFWATRTGEGGVCAGAKRGQSAGGASTSGDGVAKGGQGREEGGVGAGGECGVSGAGGRSGDGYGLRFL
jgi:hypothetical protein